MGQWRTRVHENVRGRYRNRCRIRADALSIPIPTPIFLAVVLFSEQICSGWLPCLRIARENTPMTISAPAIPLLAQVNTYSV